MNKEKFATVEKGMLEHFNWFFENCFEFLRNGAKLKHLLKLHKKLMSIDPIIRSTMTMYQDGCLEMTKLLFNDNLLKF